MTDRRKHKTGGPRVRPATPKGNAIAGLNAVDLSAEDQAWQRLRSGARNVAGVSYQVAVTADLLVGNRVKRVGFPAVASVVPEGWEDADCLLAPGGRLYVQVKERGPGSAPMGAAEVADVIVHAAIGLAAAGRLGEAEVALVTDCELASGLAFSGWSESVAAILSRDASEALGNLRNIVAAKLLGSDFAESLSGHLLERTHLVSRPWHICAETQNDLAAAYSITHAEAFLAHAILLNMITRVSADQRRASASEPRAVTGTDLDRIVSDLTAAVDVASLEEAVIAGVCEPVDYLRPSDLTEAQFFAGIDVSPQHIVAGLDVLRVDEMGSILAGLEQRRHVLLAGPSGSGKSALLWRAGHIVARGARTLRVRRVEDVGQVEMLVRHVRRCQPSETSRVLVCADNLGDQALSLWGEALPRLLEMPGVYVLSAVRREDYASSQAASGVVIDPRLTPASAIAIYKRLVGDGISVALETEEAIQLADGLLMEYLALLTTGRRLRVVLEKQVDSLRAPERSVHRHALRLVCAAHVVGSPLSAATLGDHLAYLVSGDTALVGDALRLLEGEHLVLHDPALGVWRGLHDLRTEVLQGLIHESPPPTLGQTLSEVIALLPRDAQAYAVVRAAEHVARQAVSRQARPPGDLTRVGLSVTELTVLLRPIAEVVRILLSRLTAGPDEALHAAALLEAGERLDTIAYVYAVLPLIEAGRPDGIDTATIAGMAYSNRNQGVRLPNIGGGLRANRFADSLPCRESNLCGVVIAGLDGDWLTNLASHAPIPTAVRLLEASEGLLTLTPEEATLTWCRLVGALPTPPGASLDPAAAEWRARLVASIAEVAGLQGSALENCFGTTQERAEDAVASDPNGVSIRFELEDDSRTQEGVSPSARKSTWRPGTLLVVKSDVFGERSEPLASAYPPWPGSSPGIENDAFVTCRRLLDACPELDRADVRIIGADGEPIEAGGHPIGIKNLRSGVTRVGLAVRRNVAFQAAVARTLAERSWSARLRAQAEVAASFVELLGMLPLRLRLSDNRRRRSEWIDQSNLTQHKVVNLPGRPIDPGWERVALAGFSAADEVARARDLQRDALSSLSGALVQAAEALDGPDWAALAGAGSRLRDVPAELAKARAGGAPIYSSVGETLPTELDRLAAQASVLLLAVARDPDCQRRVQRSRTPEEMAAVAARKAEEQADFDLELLAERLRVAGIERACSDLPDPDPLAGRLNGGCAVAFVPAAQWALCEQILHSWPPEEREGTTGHLVAVAVEATDVLPVGFRLTASVDQGLPMGDLSEFQALADSSGRRLVAGPALALYREVANGLVAWSGLISHRARRTQGWAQPPLPTKGPEGINADLDEYVRAMGLVNTRAADSLAVLRQLAAVVVEEDGIGSGLAAQLAKVLNGSGPGGPAVALLERAHALALAADHAGLTNFPTR